MEYQVLYRKYRPHDFDSLVGQEYTKKLLKNSVKSGKFAHAYIFTGPRGTGKTSSAKIFAKAINCLNPVDGNPCNKCENCLNFSSSPDIIELDAASNNGVDDIREIINNVRLAPNSMKIKVYIIDEFHMLSTSAFNALLLTLEEPPKDVVFILATTDIQSVPITVLSRCQRFDFKSISLNDIENRLKYICEQENIDITEDAIKEIALMSNGGLRDALSILDQLSSLDCQIDVNAVINNFGGVSNKKLKECFFEFLNCINDIDKYIEDFWKNNKKYIRTNLLKKCKNEVVIISASPKFLLEPICKKLSIKYLIATDIDKNTGKFKSLNCKGKEKINRLNKEIKEYKICDFYSDSYSDEPLASKAENAYFIQKDKIENWNYQNKKNLDLKEIIRYSFIGLLTMIITLLTYYLLTFAILNPTNEIQLQLANIVSWSLAVIFSYLCNRKYVFNSINKNIKTEMISFFISRLFTLLIDMLGMYITVSVFNLNDKIMKIIVQIIVVILNYIISKFLVFRRKQ